MNISIFTWDEFHNDLFSKVKKLIGIFFDFLHCCKKVHDNIIVEIKNLIVIHESWSIKSNSGTVFNFHNSWPLQEVIHDKIILKACFDSSVENIYIQSN